MNHQITEALLIRDRLTRLERQHARLRCTCSALLLVIVSLVGLGWSAGDAPVLEATRYVVRDSDGRARAELGVSDDHSAALILRDREERARIWLGLSAAAAPRLEFRNPDGTPVIVLEATTQKELVLRLQSQAASSSARLGVPASGDPELRLERRHGDSARGCRIWVDEAPHMDLLNWDAGPASVAMYDARGRLRAGINVSAEGDPQLLFLDGDDHIVYRAP